MSFLAVSLRWINPINGHFSMEGQPLIGFSEMPAASFASWLQKRVCSFIYPQTGWVGRLQNALIDS